MCRLFFFFFSFVPPPASGAAFTTIFSSTLSFSFFLSIFSTWKGSSSRRRRRRAPALGGPRRNRNHQRTRTRVVAGLAGEGKKNPVWWRSRGEKCMGGELWTCRRDFPSFSLLSLSPLASLALTLRSSLASPPFPSLSLPPPFLMSSASHEKKTTFVTGSGCVVFFGSCVVDAELVFSLFVLQF